MILPPQLAEPIRVSVRGGNGETIDVTAHIDGDTIEQSMIGSNYEKLLVDTLPRLDSLFFSAEVNVGTKERVAEELVMAILPSKIRRAIRNWSSATGGNGVLVIDAASPYDSLPWELLPTYFSSGLFVVRDLSDLTGGAARQPGLSVPAPAIAAGWPTTAAGVFLPGIVDEVSALGIKFPFQAPNAALEVQSRVDDEWSLVSADIREQDLTIAHLALASGFTAAGIDRPPRLILFAEQYADADNPHDVTIDEVISSLKNANDLRLIVLNTMAFPIGYDTSVLRRLATELGIAVVGWVGRLTDELGTDFASYWYQRAVEGMTLPEISHSFVQRLGGSQWVDGAMPIVMVPDQTWMSEPVIDTARTRTFENSVSQQATFDPAPSWRLNAPPPGFEELDLDSQWDGGSALGGEAPAPPPPMTVDVSTPEAQPTAALPQVAVNWSVRPSIFPAQLINGRSPITNLSIDSDRDFNGRIEVECDTGAVKSTIRRIRRFTTGSNRMISQDMTYQFPAIYELIGSDERRVISFTISVYERELIAQETVHARWLSRRDWLNDSEGWPFVGAYVLSMNNAVSELVNEAQEILSQIGRPGDRFEGYPKNQDGGERVAMQMRAIFQAVRSLGVQYITPPGLPAAIYDPVRMDPGEVDDGEKLTKPFAETKQASQIVRTPQDILDRSHGTCHDLSLLIAAAAEYVGLYPVVVLMSGHTYVGYWTSREAQHDFWQQAKDEPGADPDAWTLTQAQLEARVGAGDLVVVEANMAAHPQASFTQAQKSANRYVSHPTNRVVDVQKSRYEGVQPIMLL